MHGLTKILSAMSCDEDHAAIARPGQIGVVVTVYDSCLQGIDTRIARDINPLGRLASDKELTRARSVGANSTEKLCPLPGD